MTAREALEREGWEEFEDEFGVPCWRDKFDGTTWAGTPEIVCDEFNIEFDE